ncbi:MAG: rhomboid family intramembrane serine protease [Hyphomicrobiaceae bacterium]
MFVPIYDDNPLRRIGLPVVTWGLIILNCLLFFAQAGTMNQAAIASFAIVPKELLGAGIFGGPAGGPLDAIAVPERYTLLTYMFLHGDIFHLAGNMLFLWVFGDNIEDALGHVRFLVFYLLCGILAGLAHAIMAPDSAIPLIGASGAVAGVIAAYLLLYPRVLVWVLVMRFIPIRITAAFALGLWILTQVVMALLPYFVPDIGIGPVAWWAHIGGVIAGLVLIVLMRPAGVMLLERRPSGNVVR